MTLIEYLIQSLKQACQVNRGVQAAPIAVLWTDPERLWEASLPFLRGQLPELFTLGTYDPALRRGPAIWLKCAIAGLAPETIIPEGATPILYLPGVSRAQLRAIEDCPPEIRPLAELQYRGAFWSQTNAKDWTINAFLCSQHSGLGLDVAQDHATLTAMRRALDGGLLLTRELAELKGRLLDAHFFDALISPDVSRDLLEWINDPARKKDEWIGVRWDVFAKRCKEYGFDPVKDGELVAAEKLAAHSGVWTSVWERYCDTYRHYPNVINVLERVSLPAGFFADYSGYPWHNSAMEKQLQDLLEGLLHKSPAEARAIVLDAEQRHAERRGWIWAEMGKSNLAMALKPMAEIASLASKSPSGNTPGEMADSYRESFWQVDAAAMEALAYAKTTSEIRAVEAALRAIYTPWLENAATRFQELVKTAGGLNRNSAYENFPAGQCIFFVDGLRYDVAKRLVQFPIIQELDVSLATAWSPIPSVTASGKPWGSPVAQNVTGSSDSKDFEPMVKADGKPLTAYHFRRLLEDAGWQVLGNHETGDPAGRAWVEYGDLDHYGHEHGLKLARDLDDQLQRIAERIQELVEAGWKRIRVVTDHGWLLVPGGMPKVELAKMYAETRWGRCAVLKESAQAMPLTFSWDWCPDVMIAMAPGISSYIAGAEYGHGGLSLQECLVPVVDIVASVVATPLPSAEIASHKWRGLRCRIEVTPPIEGLWVDLRERPAAPESSWAEAPKLIENGKATLMVGDEHEGKGAHLVLLDQQGRVIQKTLTTIGG